MPPCANSVGLPVRLSASGMKSCSFDATTIQMSRPSGLLPSDTMRSCGAAAVRRRKYATVSSYDGEVRKPLFSAGVIHGSSGLTTSVRDWPFHGVAGGSGASICAVRFEVSRSSGTMHCKTRIARLYGERMQIRIALITFLFVFSAEAQPANLGDVSFANSGAPAAQESFLRGLALLHDFEYTDAATAFREAQSIDPEFAMAFWGEAMTFNHPIWFQQDFAAARAVLAKTPKAKTE